VKREREIRAMQLNTGTPWENIVVTALSRDRTLFPPLLAEARDAALRGQEGYLVVHTAWGTEWQPFGHPRRKRPLRSVVLAPGVAEKVVEDVHAFLARREWYAARGGSYTFFSYAVFNNRIFFFRIGCCLQAFRIAEGICSMDRRDRESRRLFRLSLARCRTTYAC
jgi:BCS1 N terminal